MIRKIEKIAKTDNAIDKLIRFISSNIDVMFSSTDNVHALKYS